MNSLSEQLMKLQASVIRVRIPFTGYLTIGIMLIGYVGFSQNPAVTSPRSETGAPVETRPTIAKGQHPAFSGQTRVGSLKSATTFTVTTVANGLVQPWGLAFLPDGRMLVTEKRGMMRIVTQQGVVGNGIAGVPAVRAEGDGGLYDVKLDPDFATTRQVFWCYVEPVAGGSVTSVARARLSTDETKLENVQVIYRASPAYSGPNHNGSRMLFDAQGRLYVTFGERFDDEIRKKAQALDSSLGKIIRINRDGTAAAGNPYMATADATPKALPEIWSMGHRNPQGLAFHPQTGDLWETEHGPNAGDELNIIRPGADYGWPTIAYGIEYSGEPVNGGKTTQDGLEQPVYYWDPSIAPSGIMFYTGTMFPEWKNNLFVAALKGMHLNRLVIVDNKVMGEEQLLTDQKQRMRYVTQATDGSIYIITDDPQGRILRLSR
jgi:glucose/arabinose dehydrogenase